MRSLSQRCVNVFLNAARPWAGGSILTSSSTAPSSHLNTCKAMTPMQTACKLFSSITPKKTTAVDYSEKTEAYEIVHTLPAHTSGVMLTCEHASLRLPSSWKWSSGDNQRLVGTHWSYDPGSKDTALELIEMRKNQHSKSTVAIFTRYSRLLIDPNRPKTSDTLIRTLADGKPIELNANLTDAERARRIRELYDPFHRAMLCLGTAVAPPKLVLSLHSYTPEYEGQKRLVEIGVLYHDDKYLPIAQKFFDAFAKQGINVLMNEPWSGKEGFMYSAATLASHISTQKNVNCQPVMIEFRQDLITNPEWRNKVVQIMDSVLEELNL